MNEQENLEGRTLTREAYLQEHQDRMIEKARREAQSPLCRQEERAYNVLIMFTAGIAVYHGISIVSKLISYVTK
jgi:hypothetical protein